PVVDGVLPERNRLAHPADGGVLLEHGDEVAEPGQMPGGRNPRRAGAQHDNVFLQTASLERKRCRRATPSANEIFGRTPNRVDIAESTVRNWMYSSLFPT